VWRKLQPIVPAANTSVPAHFDAIQDRQRGHGERDNVIPTVTIGPRTRRPGARRFRTTHAGPPFATAVTAGMANSGCGRFLAGLGAGASR
jgi:hypothetical protein